MITRLMLAFLISFSLCSCDLATRRAEIYICLDQAGENSSPNDLFSKMEQIRAIIPDFVSVDEHYTLNQVGNLPLLHLCVTTADKETSEGACRLIVEKFARVNCHASPDLHESKTFTSPPRSRMFSESLPIKESGTHELQR